MVRAARPRIAAAVSAVTVLFVFACVPAPKPAETGPSPGRPSALAADQADFNGDGFGDVAARKVTSVPAAPEWGGNLGLVQIIYGSASGLSTDGGQQWARADLQPTNGDPDAFGLALAHADFDSDGFSDLVIGDPGATKDGWGQGQVHVLFGTEDGLTTDRSQTWGLDSPGIDLGAQARDGFGAALTVGNLDHGPTPDLSVGAPGRDEAGAVLVLFGGTGGLAADNHQLWRQGHDGLTDKGQRDDDFGRSLTAGDFDGDDIDELVIGVRYDTIAGKQGAGSVHVLRGTAEGPTAVGSQHWRVGADGIPGHPDSTDLFGDTFAVGRFSASGHLDLAIGKPGWSSSDTGGAGAVHVLYGSDNGLTGRGSQVWDEYVLGTRELRYDEPEDSPRFGASLVAANFGRGSQDDLVIGAPETLTPGWASGSIEVIYGTATGLTADGFQQISEDTGGVQGHDSDEALFGTALTVLEPAQPNGYPALAISAPFYGGDTDEDRSGAIHVIHGSVNGLTAAGDALVRSEDFSHEPVGVSFGEVMTS